MLLYRLCLFSLCFVASLPLTIAADSSRFAHSDSDSRYVHHIDLYDVQGRKITPESNQPYSAIKTCGRCHDYESISHGWHFNAFLGETLDGRAGEPWIWTDARTGTQLPLAYRNWAGLNNPTKIDISPWEVTHQFGGRIPGGGVAAATPDEETQDTVTESSRWPLSGTLDVDCMICHASSGAYDFNARREQIQDENFSWAATAGLRLGTISGEVSRIKDDADLTDEKTLEKLPKVTYDSRLFALDGTVFMDLVRHPPNNACYQCHSNRTIGDKGIDARWTHDQDVHLRAGMKCVDCHRNGIDHEITRGYEAVNDEKKEATHADNSATLSCKGCHFGEEDDSQLIGLTSRAGRLGSPFPAHEGLPPLHFDKLSCTACHAGPIPTNSAKRMMTSFSHGLGEKEHRTGEELPAIVAPVFTKQSDGKVYPHRAMWPSFWGMLSDGNVTPLNPNHVYDATRRALRVRKDFVAEIVDKEKFDESVAKALQAIEEEFATEDQKAVYVSSGFVYANDSSENDEPKLSMIDLGQIKNAETLGMQKWPIAHTVRPAGWSLGVGGCTDCHRDDAPLFAGTVAAIGPGKDDGEPVTMASLQGINADQRLRWNQMFAGRSLFKIAIASSVVLLAMVLLIGVGAFASRLGQQHAVKQGEVG